jgi:hypothetical protein
MSIHVLTNVTPCLLISLSRSFGFRCPWRTWSVFLGSVSPGTWMHCVSAKQWPKTTASHLKRPGCPDLQLWWLCDRDCCDQLVQSTCLAAVIEGTRNTCCAVCDTNRHLLCCVRHKSFHSVCRVLPLLLWEGAWQRKWAPSVCFERTEIFALLFCNQTEKKPPISDRNNTSVH